MGDAVLRGWGARLALSLSGHRRVVPRRPASSVDAQYLRRILRRLAMHAPQPRSLIHASVAGRSNSGIILPIIPVWRTHQISGRGGCLLGGDLSMPIWDFMSATGNRGCGIAGLGCAAPGGNPRRGPRLVGIRVGISRRARASRPVCRAARPERRCGHHMALRLVPTDPPKGLEVERAGVKRAYGRPSAW